MKISDLCEEIIDQYKFTGLYHSSDDYRDDIFYKPATIHDRKTRDTLLSVHNYINQELEKKLGVKVRNGMFALNRPSKDYGNNVFKVCVIPKSTRIFVSPGTVDLTLESDTDLNSILQYMMDTIKHDSRDTVFRFQMGDLVQPIKNIIYSPSIEKMKDIARQEFSAPKFVKYRDILLYSVDETIDFIKESIDRYVESVVEVNIDKVSSYDREELMIYSTDKIKLVKIDL